MGKLNVYDIIQYASRYRTFVESGSLHGDTIKEMMYFFDKLYTIELNKNLYNHTSERFKYIKKVNVIHGDSKIVIEQLAPQLPDYTLFYLDAHWSGDNSVDWDNSLWKGYQIDTSYIGETPTPYNQTPLAGELEAIVKYYTGNAIIIIDDIELVGTKDFKFIGEDWSHLSIQYLRSMVSSRVKKFDIIKSVEGSQIGLIELYAMDRKYYDVPRTYKEVTIHDCKYIVEEHEFNKLDLPDYYPMIIYDKVAHLDRLAYIINTLGEEILFDEFDHGGYLIRQLKTKVYLRTERLISKELLSCVELVKNINRGNVIYLSTIKVENTDHSVIISNTLTNMEGRNRYNLENVSYLYVKYDYDFYFRKKVRVSNDIITHDNLMQLLIMVKDAGESFYAMLEHNVKQFDRYIIMDTGSTDNTIATINKIIEKYPHGVLYQNEWKGFRDSRNELMDIAGQEYVFNIMLDDTYYLRGDLRSFLSIARADDVAESFTIYIKDDFNSYISNRISKSRLNIRYIYRLHEVLRDNINLRTPDNIAHIEDITDRYMRCRTNDRKLSDLALQLEDYRDEPHNGRVIYYIAETYLMLNDYEKAFHFYSLVTKMGCTANKEELQDSYYKLGTIALFSLPERYTIEKCGMSWQDYYLKCYETIPTRPEALYIIGYHYAINGNVDQAYHWLTKSYEVNINMTSMPNMNGKHKIYNNGIYKDLIPIAYRKGNYGLGMDCCMRIKDDDELKNFWLSVYFLLIEYYKQITTKKVSWKVCFIAPGGWSQWDGRTLRSKGLGGTETAIVRYAETMALKSRVVVLCNCERDIVYNRVTYINIYKAPEFLATNNVDTCYINRYPEYIPLCVKSGIKRVCIILHDLLRNYEVFLEKVEVYCLSEWHKGHVLSRFPLDVRVISYGIDKPGVMKKKKYSFIYPSFPNRGLIHLLDLFPKIKSRYPDAVLNVFCDLEHQWTNVNYSDMMREIKEKINQDGVINHGWVSKDVLEQYWATSHVWLYPCIFQETYCRCCLEAAANKVFTITNDLAALAENNKGFIIPGVIDSVWKDKALEVIDDYFTHEEKYSDIIERCYLWSQERRYENVINML